MSPRSAVLLNLAILLVNFLLVCVHSEAEGRVLRVATRMPAARPILRWRPAPSEPDRDTDVANAPVPHTRLLKYLARLDEFDELTSDQREALYTALDHCCDEFAEGVELVRRSHSEPRVVHDRVRASVAARLRAVDIDDDERLARLVRVVVASAG